MMRRAFTNPAELEAELEAKRPDPLAEQFSRKVLDICTPATPPTKEHIKRVDPPTSKCRGYTSRSYCWTLNNYTAEEVEAIQNNAFRYLIYGKEVGENGTPHLQGYLECHSPKTIAALKKIPGLSRAHFESRRGTRDQARKYCLKDGIIWESGNWEAGGQGSRTDWHQLHDFLKGNPDFSAAREEYPGECVMYTQGIKAIIADIKQDMGRARLEAEFERFVPSKWQHELLRELESCVDDRKVIWYVDREGGRGKTYMARYLLANKGACYLTNCKTADGAHTYNGEEIVVFDYSRSVEDRINYGIIEQIKNGLVFSPKYDSRTKVHAIPHVVCFSNFMPDRTQLSADRWDIRVLTDESVQPYQAPVPPACADVPSPSQAPDTVDDIDMLLHEAIEECQEIAKVVGLGTIPSESARFEAPPLALECPSLDYPAGHLDDVCDSPMTPHCPQSEQSVGNTVNDAPCTHCGGTYHIMTNEEVDEIMATLDSPRTEMMDSESTYTSDSGTPDSDSIVFMDIWAKVDKGPWLGWDVI